MVAHGGQKRRRNRRRPHPSCWGTVTANLVAWNLEPIRALCQHLSVLFLLARSKGVTCLFSIWGWHGRLLQVVWIVPLCMQKVSYRRCAMGQIRLQNGVLQHVIGIKHAMRELETERARPRTKWPKKRVAFCPWPKRVSPNLSFLPDGFPLALVFVALFAGSARDSRDSSGLWRARFYTRVLELVPRWARIKTRVDDG